MTDVKQSKLREVRGERADASQNPSQEGCGIGEGRSQRLCGPKVAEIRVQGTTVGVLGETEGAGQRNPPSC